MTENEKILINQFAAFFEIDPKKVKWWIRQRELSGRCGWISGMKNENNLSSADSVFSKRAVGNDDDR